ncbi:MAG: helix-turn-helix domain-containing protein [Clostridiales bacterium]|nr:helix-turn-helix domain-containing protein [Clostridiales bacterium]
MYPRIRALREDRDLNQTAVAKLLHMSQTGYSKYETGENDLPTAVLIQLARYYQTSIDYMLGLTDRAEPYPRGQEHGGESPR